jgi:DtxR family Mn-dependent transcriptional regulator
MIGAGMKPTISALGRRMHVSPQAASEMVGRLSQDGLVSLSTAHELALTAEGRRAADAIFRRHALLEWLLTRVIGLGWAESDEEAMRLQGAVSPRVADRIDELLGHPETCPHGNPIDAAAARRRPAGIPLSEAEPGSEVTIYRITEEAEEDAELLRYLEDHGLTPGTVARIREVSAGRDSVTLEGPQGEGTMGLRPAALIRVLPGRADPSLFHRVRPSV